MDDGLMTTPDANYAFTYPDLPIQARKDDILKALRDHPAIVVQGGTGSGKTTQLPKFLLEAGYAAQGLIGVTQPRRIAALSIADRLRQETGRPSLIGAQIRFHEDMPAGAEVKVMTDGILLQEFKRDPLLRRYACIILDEAHERSLNVDILLGIFKTLLPRRPEFRLVVTSATLDAERFSKFLGTAAAPGRPARAAPVVEVEGRQYPVVIEHWEPSGKGGDGDTEDDGSPARAFPPVEAAAMAIRDLQRRRPDNLLAFLPTEKEIHELHRDLERDLGKRFAILPLYSRLGSADQKKVFQDSHLPKIILATNIAETSLTIPGIAYVVDTGLARISRYHPQTKIQGLPIERISQASARQRSGRAGRVKPGICVRLYGEADFKEREPFTEPEILRSNLANVVLQLLALGLPVAEFPFPDPPVPGAIKGAFRQLHELGAVDDPGPEARITAAGRQLSRLPVDVTLGRILLKAAELGTLQPAMIIAAGLTVQDPRIQPRDEPERGKALGLHRRFEDPRSDFLGILALWNWIRGHWSDGLSQRRLRQLCLENFLSYHRLREWMDLADQFGRLMKVTLGSVPINMGDVDADGLHKAVLAGFLPFLARRKPEETGYRLGGEKEAFLHPGSSLFKRRPEWIVAGEVRQTSRVYLYRACEIKPAWVEELAPEACRRTYLNVAWNPERGFVEALERVTYKGFTIRQDRRVNYEAVAPEECAELFWREGVIRDGRGAPFPFREHNLEVLAALAALECKARMRGLVPDEDALAHGYRQRAPEVTSRVRLERFLHGAGEGALCFSLEEWTGAAAEAAGDADLWAPPGPARVPGGISHPLDRLFPDSLEAAGRRYPVSYRFDYGDPLDGMSLETDLQGLAALTPSALADGIPGWRKWIWEHFLERLGAKARQEAMDRRSDLIRTWRESPGPSPLALGFPFPATWPSHLQIHLFVHSPTGRRFLLHVDPSWGEAEAFAAAARQAFGERAWEKPWTALWPVLMGNHGGLPRPLDWRGTAFGPSPLAGMAPAGPDWAGACGFFSDGDEALFHHGLAETLGPPVPAAGLGENLPVFFRKRWKSLLDAWGCPENRRRETSRLLDFLCDAWLPARCRAVPGMPVEAGADFLARLEKELPLPKAGLPKTAAPVKTLAALGKAVARDPGPVSWVGPALALGAVWLPWPAFTRWWRFLSRPAAESREALGELLPAADSAAGWGDMLVSPFHAAWSAALLEPGLPWDGREDGAQAATRGFPEAGGLAEIRRRWETSREKEDAFRKDGKGYHTRFCARLAPLGQSVAGLPREVREALDGLTRPGSWSGQCQAQLELELYLNKAEGRAGKAAGNAAARENPAAAEAKDRQLKDLSGRFKRL